MHFTTTQTRYDDRLLLNSMLQTYQRCSNTCYALETMLLVADIPL